MSEAPSQEIASDLRRSINWMKGEAFDVKSGQVDYAHLRRSEAYAEYIAYTQRLQALDPSLLSGRKERMAFWLNLYNALVVDAVLRFDVKRSVNDVPGFFWRAAYDVGGQRYCAFDIEYGILRANRGHPAIPGPHFARDDPRRAYSLEQLDPRIHFALVCAARSCPPIAVYEAEHIDTQLELAAHAFINTGGVEIDRANNEVLLSKIFQWYAPDFGGTPLGVGDKSNLMKYVVAYVDDKANREYLLLGQATIRFQPYDWSLNQVAV